METVCGVIVKAAVGRGYTVMALFKNSDKVSKHPVVVYTCSETSYTPGFW
jgi:putative NADH-flavin reductase